MVFRLTAFTLLNFWEGTIGKLVISYIMSTSLRHGIISPKISETIPWKRLLDIHDISKRIWEGRERERERERDRDRERDRERQRDRETEIDRERERKRERKRYHIWLRWVDP